MEKDNMDLIIKNAIIVTVNEEREILYDGAIAVKGLNIADIGVSREIVEKYPDAKRVIDAKDKILFPGFINTHNHMFQTLLKGLGDDMVLGDWLSNMMFPSATYLTEEDTYYGAMQGIMEGIHSGTTTNVDFMHVHNREGLCDGVIEAFKETGIRGIMARCCQDAGEDHGVQPALLQTRDEIEKDCIRLLDKYNNREDGRIKIWTGASAMWQAEPETHKMLYEIANEYDSFYTTHIAETEYARMMSEKLFGKEDFLLLEDLGITGPNVLMIHCVYLRDDEIKRVAEYDMKVSHNVMANMYLSSGVAPINKMIKAGITVGLGVDGAASNNDQDLIETMKVTALQHKVDALDPMAMTAEKVLEMATIDGARAIGEEDKIGSLEIGKRADMVLFNPYKNSKAIPMHNPVSTLIYSSSSANIESVFVDGRAIMEDGIITTINDEEEMLRKVQKTADDLCGRAGITNRGSDRKIWNTIKEDN